MTAKKNSDIFQPQSNIPHIPPFMFVYNIWLIPSSFSSGSSGAVCLSLDTLYLWLPAAGGCLAFITEAMTAAAGRARLYSLSWDVNTAIIVQLLSLESMHN